MCGIAGSVNQPINETTLDLIHHRGPDFQSLARTEIRDSRVTFGHTRLSILDLSPTGNQPMYSVCGKYAIVFNGEVYNHLELRKKLPGVCFQGTSDTETLLYYIREYGIDRVDDFNGIFALGYLDTEAGKLYLVRDHFGCKPVYYYQEADRMVFSSELKVLLQAGVPKAINLAALDTLLTLRYNPAPGTIFAGIQKLGAGTYLTYDLATHCSRQTSYRKRAYRQNTTIGEGEAIEEYQRLFERAVERQLLSDVPVGLFLSGGLDSAMIGRVMAEKLDYPLHTFTVGFRGDGNFNELPDAQRTAEFLGSRHHAEFISKEQYLGYFRRSFYHTEEPIAEPTIPALYHVAKMAAGRVKVVMSGQGADEPMAGYKRYYGEVLLAKYAPLLKWIPYGLSSRLFRSNETMQRGLYSLQFSNELERFLAIYQIFSDAQKDQLYRPELRQQLSTNIGTYFEQFYGEVRDKSTSLNHLLYLDTRTMLPDNLLLFNDKITMAHSIENRVPFLDMELMAFVESLPVKYKLRGRTRKYLPKRAAEKWLPPELIHRKKRGFETPVVDWFRTELYDELYGLFVRPDGLAAQYFESAYLLRLLDEHRAGKRNYAKQLFILYALELWYDNFYRKV
ncbi:Asparagine synthetase [glutamine-hydrolyzing] 1 [Neolewinella maritima]|uniref:asparagine synthase (glutamine-hydrolyzing) n=1 Tax=Neolewinella maritima TaxID=1383882 RepID=A0ABN8F431_9BACT|nr:asparagine synthase (glutamine-hydrolyzing) [Neolewinella maritima]CAH0999526.1 Asparagine synthetase [glutamine-hydrolyzing] 1 [Neolewinella maritima]